MTAAIEVRDAGPGHWTATGLATTWAGRRPAYFVQSPTEGLFLEQIGAGAADRAVNGAEVVDALREHRADSPRYATTANGTLQLSNEVDGLLFVSALSKRDRATRELVADVRSGALAGLSIGFQCLRDSWGTSPKDHRTALRTVHELSLAEISFVARAANPQAGIAEIRRETRSTDPPIEYRSVELTYRQNADAECVTCGAEIDDAMNFCPFCGTPIIDTTAADREGRRDFSTKELAQLGKRGLALWLDGHWSYPTPTRADYDNAVQAVGRTPGRNRATVRKYLMRRARAERWPIPDSWASDGTIKRSFAPSFVELEAMLELSRLG